MNKDVIETKSFFWLIVLVFVVVSCGDNDSMVGPSDGPLWSDTDLKNAEILAQCLIGAIYPPYELSLQIAAELGRIQHKYGDEHPHILGIEKRRPWGRSLTLKFDSSTYEQVKRAEYEGWLNLNEQYNVRSVTLYDGLMYASLAFDDIINLCVLRHSYAQLPGVLGVFNDPLEGDGPSIGIADTPDGRAYLYFYGEGDCPAGCIYREYRYFRASPEQCELVGVWVSGEEEPDWWSEVESLFFPGCGCS